MIYILILITVLINKITVPEMKKKNETKQKHGRSAFQKKHDQKSSILQL